MENNLAPHDPPQYKTEFRAQNISLRPKQSYTAIGVLAIYFAFFVVGTTACSLIVVGLAMANGLDFNELLSNISEKSPVGTRNFMRGTLFLNHLFSFILPALATVVWVYKKEWLDYLRLQKQPLLKNIFWGLVWFIVSSPFVQIVQQWNEKLKLPEWMLRFENDTSNMLEGIIAQNNMYEIVLNVLLIGLIPAIGEEMVFRGIVQQQIGRLLKNEHLVVWLSAALFSAMHMQFQGFFGRLILGTLLGYVFIWTKNLWIPMILHFFNNSIQVAYIYIMGIKPSEIHQLAETDKIPLWLGIFSLITTIALGIYIEKMQKNANNQQLITNNQQLN